MFWAFSLFQSWGTKKGTRILPFFSHKPREERRNIIKTHIISSSQVTHTSSHAQKKNDDDDDFEESDDSSLLRRELLVWDNCFCRPGIPRQAFLFVVFSFRSFFSSSSRFGGLFFFSSSLVSTPLPPPPARRRLRRGLFLSVGVDLFGLKGVSLESSSSSSSSSSSFRRKRRIGEKNGFFSNVGKNTNHFIETLFSRGVKNTNHQNVCFSSVMTQHRRKNTMTMV